MSEIKYGRVIYTLKDGDAVMDNGACYQLIKMLPPFATAQVPPRLSKATFKLFCSMDEVSEDKDHGWSNGVRLYIYSNN